MKYQIAFTVTGDHKRTYSKYCYNTKEGAENAICNLMECLEVTIKSIYE